MSITQVNELRKNGQLHEAYEMAMNDWNQAPDDKWAGRALFWTLHDLAHEQLNQGYNEQAAELASRMKDLIPHIAEGEDEQQDNDKNLPERALARLIRHMQPFYADVRAAYHEARTGDTIAPYDYIAQLIDNKQLAEPLHERAAWIIWLHLWKQAKRMPSREARQALAYYMGLEGVPIPSELHSRIMTAAVRLSKRFPKEFDFAKFVDLWGVHNFRPEDWERGQQQKKLAMPYPSNVEQTITQYINYKKQLHEMDYSEGFVILLEKAVERYPDKPELMRYLSLTYVNRGDKERAIKMHRKLAQKLDRYYVWHELASMFTHDLDMKTAALCQALATRAPENYTCEIHRELGWELAREGNMAEALCELETYSAVRQRCGWAKSWRYDQLRKRIPADTIPAESNEQLYLERAQPIIDWVYQDLPVTPAVEIMRFEDKQGKEVAKVTLPGGKYFFAKTSKLPQGTRYFKVRVAEDGNKLKMITVEPADRNDVVPAFAESVTGDVKVMQGQGGKQYGFVEGCFVPGQLLEGITTGDTITILTEMQPDGRRRAIAII